jgi:hypothetical protein|tara:strand:+ start:227 stop:721 length:495 start_codon:yes stop_codon:yes gene_type:complete
LEILTGRPAITRQYDRSGSSFKDLVSDTEDLLNEVSSVQKIMDPLLPKTGRGSWPISNAMQFAQICAECTEPKLSKRMSINDVLTALTECHRNAKLITDAKSMPIGFETDPLAESRAEEWDQMLNDAGEENTLGRDCGFECPITSELLHTPGKYIKRRRMEHCS